MRTVKRLLLTLSCLFFVLGLAAQDFPYTLDTEREFGILALGGGMFGTGYFLETQLDEISELEIGGSSPDNLFFLDRSSLRRRSEPYRRLSDRLLRGSLWLPAAHLATREGRQQPLVLGLMVLETALLTEGSTKLLKVMVQRRRPLSYNTVFPLEERKDHDARQSFPSGHTSNTAALAFFTAKVFHDLHPDSKLRPYVWAGAAAIPALTGYARYRAGKHFPTDIIAGYALGAAVGILVPQWHKGKHDGRGVSLSPTGNGIGLVCQW